MSRDLQPEGYWYFLPFTFMCKYALFLVYAVSDIACLFACYFLNVAASVLLLFFKFHFPLISSCYLNWFINNKIENFPLKRLPIQ